MCLTKVGYVILEMTDKYIIMYFYSFSFFTLLLPFEKMVNNLFYVIIL